MIIKLNDRKYFRNTSITLREERQKEGRERERKEVCLLEAISDSKVSTHRRFSPALQQLIIQGKKRGIRFFLSILHLHGYCIEGQVLKLETD